jgi:hypothetical protein
MRRGDERRFARLEQRLPPDPAQAERSRRRRLRLEVAWGWLIHDMAAAAGVDTDTIAALRYAEQAAAALAALGDTPELAAADAAAIAADHAASQRRSGEPDPREELLRRLRRIGASFADGERPRPNAAFMTWLGWAMAQRPLTREVLERAHTDAGAMRLAAADAGATPAGWSKP